MTNAKLMLVTAAVLVTAGAAARGSSATRPENPAPTGVPPQVARQPAAAPQVAQDPGRPSGAKPSTDQGPLIIQAEVVDPEGRRLSGADVAVTFVYSRSSGALEMVPERSKSNAEGQVRLEVARERPGAMLSHAVLWAYLPGRAIATASVGPRPVLLAQIASPPVIPLTLAQPAKWTITVLGPEDRPVAGLRLAPTLLLSTVGRTRSIWNVPDGLLELLTVATDAQGVATLTYLPQTTVLRAIQVAGPGVAPHALRPDAPQGMNIVLKLGRSGRVVGVVRTASGQPLADVPVEVWVRGWGTVKEALRASGRVTADAILRLDPRPLKTGPQGAFQTPPTLLNGSSYRVSIRQDGFVPFVSNWVTLDGERVTIPPIRLQPLRKLTGQIKDRQGRPVAGARVFLPADGPSIITDAQGRFDLRDIHPDRTIVLVEQPGFRLRGWPVDPATQADELRLTLARTSEAPDRIMTALAEPIPPDEARALADRVLEPYLRDVLEKGNDISMRPVLEILSTFDLERALDLFNKGVFQNELASSSFRAVLAREIAERDPAGAEALLEPIADPWGRATGLLTLARALPPSKRERKRQLLERMVPLVRGLPNSNVKIAEIATMAQAWLDLGEVERARPLLQEGLKLFDAIPYTPRNNSVLAQFVTQLARLEPEQAMARIQKIPATLRAECFAEAAPQIAIDQPAMAERFFNLKDGPDRGIIAGTMLLCRRLARVDPPRARRVAASISGPGERVCAWAFVALGLAEHDQAGALEALDQAIQGIDRLRESGPGLEPETILQDRLVIYPTNPAALILPLVERVAPARLAEVFWRAVALHPRVDVDWEELLQVSSIGFECTLLARYDREAAAVLFAPMDSYLRSLVTTKDSAGFNASAIVGKACIDPRAAVELLEALPPARDLGQGYPANQARLQLAEALGQPAEKRWKSPWRHNTAQLPLDD